MKSRGAIAAMVAVTFTIATITAMQKPSRTRIAHDRNRRVNREQDDPDNVTTVASMEDDPLKAFLLGIPIAERIADSDDTEAITSDRPATFSDIAL